MNAEEQQMLKLVGLRDQCLAASKEHTAALIRICQDGPDGSEYDAKLCRMMAHQILADLCMSNHDAKGEND